MYTSNNDYRKHLTLSKRVLIEQSLNENKSFKDIGELISKSEKPFIKRLRGIVNL